MRFLVLFALVFAPGAVAEEVTDAEVPARINTVANPDAMKWDDTPCAEGDFACLFKYWRSLDAANTEGDPWAAFHPIEPVETPEKLGAGPHTLIIADGDSMTRMEYTSGPKCQKARDEVRRQNAPPPNSPGVIYAPSRIKAFCVPR